jgi:hypothetical protein
MSCRSAVDVGESIVLSYSSVTKPRNLLGERNNLGWRKRADFDIGSIAFEVPRVDGRALASVIRTRRTNELVRVLLTDLAKPDLLVVGSRPKAASHGHTDRTMTSDGSKGLQSEDECPVNSTLTSERAAHLSL